MENARLHFVALLSTFLLFTRYSLSAEEKEPCSSPQNGTIGGVGIIKCSFKSGFNKIAWSYTGKDTDPLVRYDTQARLFQSHGHDSKSYSLQIDGSLLIIDAASRNGSIEYEVVTTNKNGTPWSQTVVYQFTGESTTTHHQNEMYTASPTTSTGMKTTSSGCPKMNVVCVLLSVGVIIIAFGVGCFVGRACKKDTLQRCRCHELCKNCRRDSQQQESQAVTPDETEMLSTSPPS